MKIRIDVRDALINFFKIKRDVDNKRNRKFYETIMVIARTVIYSLFYKEDKLSKNDTFMYELIKKIRLHENMLHISK